MVQSVNQLKVEFYFKLIAPRFMGRSLGQLHLLVDMNVNLFMEDDLVPGSLD